MTNNLKIEVLVSNIPEDGSIASQFPSQEYVNQQLAKKANLSPEGRLDPSHAPDYTEIPGLYEHIEDTKDAIETSIANSLQDAKGYTNQQLSTSLRNKADLVNGKIPFDQIPFSADIEDQIQINVENITAVVDQKVAQVVGQVNEAATAANAYTDTKVGENKAYIDRTIGNIIEDVSKIGVSKSLTVPTYLTPEDGVASGTGVAAGAYFNVRSEDDDTVAVEYQNMGGSAVETGKSYLSALGAQQQEKSASTIIDASGKTQQEINAKLASMNQLTVSPKWFGAPNNGIDDDAAGIRAAIAFLKIVGGGVLDLQSKNNWQLLTKHTSENANIVVDFANIAIKGGTQTTVIRSKVIDVEAQILFKSGAQFVSIQDVNFHGGRVANYNVQTAAGVFVPYLHTNNSTFYVANLAGMSVNTYVSLFSLTRWGFSVDGLQINPNADVATTLVFNSCYAQNCTGSGYKTIGNVIYSSFNSCASDHNSVAYDLNNCNVVLLNACGTEKSDKALKVRNSGSVIVSGLCLLGCGSTNSSTPTDALIDVQDSRLILDGYRNLPMVGRTTYYTKEAKTLGWGFIDARRSMSLSRKNVSKGIHPDLESTILCWDDETHADQTFNVAPSDLAAFITDNLRDRIINHKLTIQLSNGAESTSSVGKNLTNMKGYGSVIIQGSATDRSAVTLLGAHYRLQAVNNTCNIVFKNLKIVNGDSNDRTFHQLRAVGSKDVILDNVEISATGQVGAAIFASGNTRVKLINNSEPTQTANANYTVVGVFVTENGAEITHAARASAPTTGYFGRSTFIPSQQNVNDILGWYCDGSGSTVSGWKVSKVYTGV